MPRGNSEYTREQRDAFAARAIKIGAPAVAKAAKVHVQTIQNWKADLRKRQKITPPIPPTNGASNGHAPKPTPAAMGGFDALEAKLEGALVELRAMRAAYRSVVLLAAENGLALALGFEAHIVGHAHIGGMPILWDEQARTFLALQCGRPVTLEEVPDAKVEASKQEA